jgi:antitoxin MazE
MSSVIRSKVVKIGNSRGIRIPRTLLDQAGLVDEVEMIVQGNKLIIYATRKPRQDWESQFAAMAEIGDDQLLDELTPVQWDENEWIW